MLGELPSLLFSSYIPLPGPQRKVLLQRSCLFSKHTRLIRHYCPQTTQHIFLRMRYAVAYRLSGGRSSSLSLSFLLSPSLSHSLTHSLSLSLKKISFHDGFVMTSSHPSCCHLRHQRMMRQGRHALSHCHVSLVTWQRRPWHASEGPLPISDVSCRLEYIYK